MTAALDLLRRLTAAGVTLDLEDEDVRCRGPRATLTTQVLEELASCKAEIVVELQRWSAQEPCCPADVFEIIGARLPSHEADARALAEYGFASWAILAHAHRTHILAQIRGLAMSDGDRVQRLLTATCAFLDTNHWHEAIQLGWTMTELFGVLPGAPVVRVDGQGLVPSIALSKLPDGEIISIKDYGAVISQSTGSRLTFYRCKPPMDYAVPWWACEEIAGSAEEKPASRKEWTQHGEDETGPSTNVDLHARVPITVSGQ